MTARASAGAHAAPARHDDPEVARLFSDALAALASERGGEVLTAELLAGRTAREALAAVEGAAGALLVGRFDDAPCALALVTADAPRATLQLLYVEEGFREVGVGEAVLTAVEQWCRSHDLSPLDVVVPPGARAAKSLLEQLGYITRLLVMSRELR